MKNIIFAAIFIVSLITYIYGRVKNEKKIKEIGAAGFIFLAIAGLSDLIDWLDI